MFSKTQVLKLTERLRTRHWVDLDELEQLAERPAVDALHWAGVLRSRTTPTGGLEYQWVDPDPRDAKGLWCAMWESKLRTESTNGLANGWRWTVQTFETEIGGSTRGRMHVSAAQRLLRSGHVSQHANRQSSSPLRW